MSQELNVQILEEEPNNIDLSFKIIVIGDSFVGKSCLAMKATKGIFEDNYTPTVGFEFFTFFVKIEDSNLKLQIWDTCGQETYRSLISSFYHNSSLAMLVYSIDNKNSFDNLEMWLNEIKNINNPDINLFLIGNKADLEEKREITKEIANDFCHNHGITFFLETSAKTGLNTQKVFLEAAKSLFNKHLKYKDRLSRPYSLNNLLGKEDSDDNKNKLTHDNNSNKEEDKPRKKKCC